MACQTVGFACMKHNEMRDLTALKLKGATVEPVLLPLQSQRLAQFTANGSNGACVDGCAKVVPEATRLGDKGPSTTSGPSIPWLALTGNYHPKLLTHEINRREKTMQNV